MGPTQRDVDTYQYNDLNQMVAKEECGYIQSITNIHNFAYTYDKRGNLVKEEEICSPTTTGPQNITIATYLYDETNRMVQGTNKAGEASLYTFNGLGVRVGTELILEDNTHGYTDFHCQTPSIETGVGGPQGPEVVKSDYVVDYTRLNIDQRVLVKSEQDGYGFRYVYGLDKLQVRVTGEGTDWWGQSVSKCVLMNYVHTNRLGSVVNLSDQFGRVTARAGYDDWGKVTAYDSITVGNGYRILLPELTYATHEYDDVLDMYYAKARMYDADNRRFAAVDSVKGTISDPLSLVQYLYVKNSPLGYVDLLGLVFVKQPSSISLANGKAIDTLYKNERGQYYVDMNEAFSAYGMNLGVDGNSGHSKDKSLYYDGVFTPSSQNIPGLAGTYTYTFRKNKSNIMLQKVPSPMNFSLYYQPDGNNTHRLISWSYFQEFVCALGYKQDYQISKSVQISQQLLTQEQLDAFGWKADDTFVTALNNALVKYHITDRASIALFLATMAAESGYGKSTIELGSDSYFAGKSTYGKNDRGAGYIQVTHRETHLEFLASMGDNFSGVDTATYIAKNYPVEASAWFWSNAAKSGEGNLNNYVTKYGGDERIFIVTQYYVVGFLDKNKYPMFSSDLSSLRNGSSYKTENGNLYINGRVYPLPGHDWDARIEPYKKAVEIFGI